MHGGSTVSGVGGLGVWCFIDQPQGGLKEVTIVYHRLFIPEAVCIGENDHFQQ
jgi:hypothetical protein